MSPAVAKERGRALTDLKALALREPLNGYRKDFAASAHYNSEYLRRKDSLPYKARLSAVRSLASSMD